MQSLRSPRVTESEPAVVCMLKLDKFCFMVSYKVYNQMLAENAIVKSLDWS